MDGYPLCRNLSTKHDVSLIAYTGIKKNSPERVAHHEPRDLLIRRERKVRQPSLVPVSYTHLTLPTILRV